MANTAIKKVDKYGIEEGNPLYGLTMKQKKFVNVFLETSNKTEAAMQAFDCKDRVVASTVGNEYFRKPAIARAIHQSITDDELLAIATDNMKSLMSQNMDIKVKNDMSKFVAKTAGKTRFSERSENVNISLQFTHDLDDDQALEIARRITGGS